MAPGSAIHDCLGSSSSSSFGVFPDLLPECRRVSHCVKAAHCLSLDLAHVASHRGRCRSAAFLDVRAGRRHSLTSFNYGPPGPGPPQGQWPPPGQAPQQGQWPPPGQAPQGQQWPPPGQAPQGQYPPPGQGPQGQQWPPPGQAPSQGQWPPPGQGPPGQPGQSLGQPPGQPASGTPAAADPQKEEQLVTEEELDKPDEYEAPAKPKMKVTGPIIAAVLTPPVFAATAYVGYVTFVQEGPVKTEDLGGDEASEIVDSDFAGSD